MEEALERRREEVKRIRLKKTPSFYEDLTFSNWLQKDRLLGVVLDRYNRVQEVRMDPRNFKWVSDELKARHYI